MVAMALVISASGCATRFANIDHRMLLPQGGDQIELQSQQLFVMPIALAQPQPAFPPQEAGAAPVEVTVCAELWLSADGDVARVLPFDDAPDCASKDDADASGYAQAAAEALRHWEFTPAMICDFPPQALDKRERGDCTGPEIEVRRVPVRLDYAFTFSSRDGRRSVGVARTQAR